MSTGDTTLLWIVVGTQTIVLCLAVRAYYQVRKLKRAIDTLYHELEKHDRPN